MVARGRTLVTASYDLTVRVWDLATGLCKWVLVGHADRGRFISPILIHLISTVYCVVFDPARQKVFSGSADNTVRIWALQNGQCCRTLVGHADTVELLSLSPSYLVSASKDSTLCVWDPDTGDLIHTFSGHSAAIQCVQHDECKVLSGGSIGKLLVWDVRRGTLIRTLLTGSGKVWIDTRDLPTGSICRKFVGPVIGPCLPARISHVAIFLPT